MLAGRRNGNITTSGSCSWQSTSRGGILTVMSNQNFQPAPVYFNVSSWGQTSAPSPSKATSSTSRPAKALLQARVWCYDRGMGYPGREPVLPVDDVAAAAKVWAAMLGAAPTFVDGDRWGSVRTSAGRRIALAGTDRVSDLPGIMIKGRRPRRRPRRRGGGGPGRRRAAGGPHETRLVVTAPGGWPVILYASAEGPLTEGPLAEGSCRPDRRWARAGRRPLIGVGRRARFGQDHPGAGGGRGAGRARFSLDDVYRTGPSGRRWRATSTAVRRARAAGDARPGPGRETIAALQAGGPVALPTFDKLADERAPPEAWPVLESRGERAILVDGWCLGALAQDEAALAAPVNPLELERDP